jgi:hypothetical protein
MLSTSGAGRNSKSPASTLAVRLARHRAAAHGGGVATLDVVHGRSGLESGVALDACFDDDGESVGDGQSAGGQSCEEGSGRSAG